MAMSVYIPSPLLSSPLVFDDDSSPFFLVDHSSPLVLSLPPLFPPSRCCAFVLLLCFLPSFESFLLSSFLVLVDIVEPWMIQYGSDFRAADVQVASAFRGGGGGREAEEARRRK